MLLSCSGAEASFEDIMNDFPEETDSVQVLRKNVLVIGNSLSRDACSYVPFLLEELYPIVSLNFDIYYKGGVGLSSHWNSINTLKNDHTLDFYLHNEGKWQSVSNVNGEDVIKWKKWDLVILQEGNVSCRDYQLTSTNISNIVSWIRKWQSDCPIAYLMVPPQPEGSSVLGEYTSDEMWSVFSITAQQLADNEFVSYVIPCGTAIQNARHTHLDNYGDYGHLTFDGTHLQEGLPCLIEAYTVAQSLFTLFNLRLSIEQSNLVVTNDFVESKMIPGRHGSVITGSMEDYELCKRCALAAVADPYHITLFE